jgi:hypothetical protein
MVLPPMTIIINNIIMWHRSGQSLFSVLPAPSTPPSLPQHQRPESNNSQ